MFVLAEGWGLAWQGMVEVTRGGMHFFGNCPALLSGARVTEKLTSTMKVGEVKALLRAENYFSSAKLTVVVDDEGSVRLLLLHDFV